MTVRYRRFRQMLLVGLVVISSTLSYAFIIPSSSISSPLNKAGNAEIARRNIVICASSSDPNRGINFNADESPSSSSSSSSSKFSGTKNVMDARQFLKERLQWISDTVGDIDRMAVYLQRRNLIDGSLESTPGAVFPESEKDWMIDHIPKLQQVRERIDTEGLSWYYLANSQDLALPVVYGSKLVAMLVVDDRRIKEDDKEEEAGGSLVSEQRLARLADLANRALGVAIKDTLISDKVQAPAMPSLSNASSSRLPMVRVSVNQSTSGESSSSTSLLIPSALVTTSVASRNVTFDLHLLEDFRHLFDDINMGNMQNNTNLLILSVAAPVVAALALEPLISLVDTYYVGQYLDGDITQDAMYKIKSGSVSLSAYGLSERVFVFSLYVLNFLATSTTPIVATLRAQGDEEAAGELVGRLLFFAAVFGFLLIPILQTLCYPLLNILGASPENYVEAVEYFQVRSWGVPALMLMAVSNGALRGYLDTTTPLLVAAIAFVVDYSVDPQLVYPQDPKGLGAAGAATVVAEWLSAGLFLTKFITMKPAILPIFDLFPPWTEMAPVVKASAQIFVRTVLLQTIYAASCAAAARIGPLDIAAHQVALQLWLPPSFLIDAFSVAAQGLVADSLGREDRSRARELGQRLITWGVGMGGLLSLIYVVVQILEPGLLPRFFTEDEGILDKVTPIIWLIAIMQPLNGLVNVGAGVLQGAQDFSYQVLTMGLSAIFAGSLFFLVRDEGLTAVWETLLAFQCMRALLFAYRFSEPLGPLSVLPARKQSKIIIGSTFSHDKDDRKNRKKKKKRRYTDFY